MRKGGSIMGCERKNGAMGSRRRRRVVVWREGEEKRRRPPVAATTARLNANSFIDWNSKSPPEFRFLRSRRPLLPRHLPPRFSCTAACSLHTRSRPRVSTSSLARLRVSRRFSTPVRHPRPSVCPCVRPLPPRCFY